MTIIQIYFFCLFTDANNKSTQKKRLSETTLLSEQNQMYKQVVNDFFKISWCFSKCSPQISPVAPMPSTQLNYRMLRRLVTGTTDTI